MSCAAKLIEAANGNRYGHRDATMILVAYRPGLRASEICELRWDDIDLRTAAMHVKRLKHGQATTHQGRRRRDAGIEEAAKGPGTEVALCIRQ